MNVLDLLLQTGHVFILIDLLIICSYKIKFSVINNIFSYNKISKIDNNVFTIYQLNAIR